LYDCYRHDSSRALTLRVFPQCLPVTSGKLLIVSVLVDQGLKPCRGVGVLRHD
jgi:hypothetical protein